MEWYLYIAVVAAGFIAGFINTLAGSGSLITLPLLIFLGLPANVANGTNRVAILLQNVVSVSSFRRQKVLDIRRGLILAAPAVIGAIIGAQIAVILDEEMMRKAIGLLMVVMLSVMIVRPKRWLVGRPESAVGRLSWIQILTFFGIGAYGGFIQAGVGIFLLAGLVLSAGYDLVRANAVKVLIVFCFTPLALVVFLINGQVDWSVGLILAVGNMSGAWVAARMAVKRGAAFVRWLLMAVVIISASVFLGLFDLIKGLF
ncbi:MAG: sulfite exporter TauE/SafE family protein [candidate division Zixibacteria bacterium]|nr:sulfite exporter TauE/SafE family protein [candidate division Zixibacteria bacterium]MBU1469421.1 sulfite exporter TauE/SafE family protein [candidate division Zixibacteria bacterium]MBU2624175.1 sulfite exporter TauE/SafE family protein [candidate division Zixibacteria bacterium]